MKNKDHDNKKSLKSINRNKSRHTCHYTYKNHSQSLHSHCGPATLKIYLPKFINNVNDLEKKYK